MSSYRTCGAGPRFEILSCSFMAVRSWQDRILWGAHLLTAFSGAYEIRFVWSGGQSNTGQRSTQRVSRRCILGCWLLSVQGSMNKVSFCLAMPDNPKSAIFAVPLLSKQISAIFLCLSPCSLLLTGKLFSVISDAEIEVMTAQLVMTLISRGGRAGRQLLQCRASMAAVVVAAELWQ